MLYEVITHCRYVQRCWIQYWGHRKMAFGPWRSNGVITSYSIHYTKLYEPKEKPNIPLSAAMQRMFEYMAPRAQDNELYTTFKYTKIEGFDYHGGDGTISRRDPSRPIKVNGKYYMWYTKRDTKIPPIGVV